MQTPRQPSYRELDRKLKAAQAAFDAGCYAPVDHDTDRHIAPDMEQLGLSEIADYWDLVYECIELAREAPLTSFRPPSPSKSTKHKSISDLTMWAFAVDHPTLKRELYLNFASEN
jgi:hypothetical protein